MKIELRPLAEVKPYEKNPRNNEGAVAAVAESIQRFGFRQPIVVDAEGVIICGHTRHKAAAKLGLEKVPVHVARDLTPEQVRALRIADNKTAELAEWNLELLPIELAELQDAGIDWSMLGFDGDELAQLLDPGAKDGLTDPDEIPEPPDEAITQPGDLWILGEHRLLCGDSSKPEDVDRLLGGQPIHLVNSDPPYNVRVEPRSNNAIAAGLSSFSAPDRTHHQAMDLARHPEKSKATHRKLRAKDRPLANDFVTDEEFDRLLLAWFGNMSRVLLPGRGFYIWGGYANCANYPPVLKATGLYFSQAIIWDKQHPVLTRKDFMGAHEWCQPPDTVVHTPSGTTPIHAIRDGDRIISFDPHTSTLVGGPNSPAVRVTNRGYDSPLYGVVANGRTTWSTDGHIWSVKWMPELKSTWCVYLLRRGQRWRAGRCKMWMPWGIGVKRRLQMDDGDDLWILSIHEDKEAARLAEEAISVKYGIPTIDWSEARGCSRTEAAIAKLYERLDLDALQVSARQALFDHHRNLRYPFYTRGQLGLTDKHGAVCQIRTCNLLPKVMAVPSLGKAELCPWAPLRAIDVQPYSGLVYSMHVERHHHYVADGLVTHNCFYGWKEGAAHVFLGPNNATDLWAVKKVNPQSMIHLTEKPVELAVRAMQYSSRAGENVLDLFGGSGSTLIAAEQTGRRAYLMELDPLYADVIVQRWEKFTGSKAEQVSAETVV